MYRLYGYRSNRCPSLEKPVELLVSKGTDINGQGEFQRKVDITAMRCRRH